MCGARFSLHGLWAGVLVCAGLKIHGNATAIVHITIIKLNLESKLSQHNLPLGFGCVNLQSQAWELPEPSLGAARAKLGSVKESEWRVCWVAKQWSGKWLEGVLGGQVMVWEVAGKCAGWPSNALGNGWKVCWVAKQWFGKWLESVLGGQAMVWEVVGKCAGWPSNGLGSGWKAAW